MEAQLLEHKTVLVVDDEVTVCRGVERILQRAGYRVVWATTVAEALAILETRSPIDLVLADLMMPDTPGLEFIRMAGDRWPGLPIVVITGYASVASAVEATRRGAIDYLAKPFTPEELKAVVDAALLRGSAAWGDAAVAPEGRKGEPEPPASIDVDLPFDPIELARATSLSYVRQLSRSDLPVIDFKKLPDMHARAATPARAHVSSGMAGARAASGSPERARDDVLDVDLPFSAEVVAEATSPFFGRALGRSDLPTMARGVIGTPAKWRVLVVDDEVVVVRSIRRSLEGRGWQVDEAFSGADALAHVATRPYDLILLDLRMPDADGLDLVPRIRRCQPDVAIVIVTGYASTRSAVEAIRRGAVDYLSKPFTPEEIRRAAARALRLAA